MRLVIIGLILFGFAFLLVMGLGVALVPSGDGHKNTQDSVERDGPGAFYEILGVLFSPLAPRATPVDAGNRCSGAGALFVAASSETNRLSRARLSAGDGAKLSFTGLDPRADNKPMPIVLCLLRQGASVTVPSDCENKKLSAEATFAIGPRGGCFTIDSFGAGNARVTWN
jgi:hypothetical protein